APRRRRPADGPASGHPRPRRDVRPPRGPRRVVHGRRGPEGTLASGRAPGGAGRPAPVAGPHPGRRRARHAGRARRAVRRRRGPDRPDGARREGPLRRPALRRADGGSRRAPVDRQRRTAGARRPPAAGVTTIRIEPGDLSPEALAARMGEGLLVTEVLGIHTADPVSGDFSVGGSGFLVTGGEVGRPVRGLALAGNLVDLLGRVTAVGNDVRVGASTAAPSLLVDELAVSGG